MDVRELIARQLAAAAYFNCAERLGVHADASEEEVEACKLQVNSAFAEADRIITALANQGYCIQKER